MIVDLKDYRPQNESQEHFLLKQVGRAFLFNQGIRCIATEVRASGVDHPPFGTNKSVIDVIGIDKRNKHNKNINKLWWKIETKALEIGKTYEISRESQSSWSKGLEWVNYHLINDQMEKLAMRNKSKPAVLKHVTV